VITLRRCIIVAAVLLTACSSTGTRSGSGSSSDQNRLTNQEIREVDPNLTLLEVINRVRPQWLTRHGGTPLQEASDVVVYRDDIRMGGRDALREIRMDIVTSVRYLSASEATGRYGLNHQHGAILVTTHR
jgi:hypothetical protein